MPVKLEIGHRFRQFGEERYSSMAEYARALNIKPRQLYDYFNGKSLPGNKLQEKLRALGCDLNWLLTGLDREETNKKFSEMVARISQQEVTKDEMEIVAILRVLEITTPTDFHIYFDYARAVQDKIKKGTAKPHQYKRGAEPQAKYQTKSRRGKK